MTTPFLENLRILSDILWGPGMLALVLGTGLFLHIRLRFLPLRKLPAAVDAVLGKDARQSADRQSVSPFSALMTTLAATVGTGNMAGVAAALTAGGPGALLWMEMTALIGLATKYSECFLSVKYRKRYANSLPSGGPMYVLRDVLGWEAPAFLYATALFIAAFCNGAFVQTSAMAGAVKTACSIPDTLTGMVAAVLTLLVFTGGLRAVYRFSTMLTPLMLLLYVTAGVWVIWVNRIRLPGVLLAIIHDAFSPCAITGGTLSGWMLSARWGIARGIFSNEAGLGTAAVTAAAVGDDPNTADFPVRQAYMGMTAVFFDTMLVCTVTGLALCTSGVLYYPVDAGGMTVLALQSGLGTAGEWIAAVSAVLFAFTSIISWGGLGERAAEYLFEGHGIWGYRLCFCLAVLWGAKQTAEGAFLLSDICGILLCLPNLLSLLALSGDVARDTKAHRL